MKQDGTADDRITACIVLADGTVFPGQGFGSEGIATGEICFNTAMTGYQEIMTDPSYAGQIVMFTFPHIGNVGATADDNEAATPHALGMITREHPSQASNWRADSDLGDWMRRRLLVGIGRLDTRRLTRAIRESGALHGAIEYRQRGEFGPEDFHRLTGLAQNFRGLTGADLAGEVTCETGSDWTGSLWTWPDGHAVGPEAGPRVAVVDYGVKQNILRCLCSVGCRTRLFSATATADEILDWKPEGIFLSNGPGDPAATGRYAVGMIRELLERSDIPLFGICLGHQLLALALGAATTKMNHGHHGANHPVKDLDTGHVTITSMNHGFMVDRNSLPAGVVETHRSLFDGSNCGIRMTGRPVFSVQFHPEASPGPQDSYYLFREFAGAIQGAEAG